MSARLIRRHESAIGIKFNIFREFPRYYQASFISFPNAVGDFHRNFAVFIAGKSVHAVKVDSTDAVGVARGNNLRIRRILHYDLASGCGSGLTLKPISTMSCYSVRRSRKW